MVSGAIDKACEQAERKQARLQIGSCTDRVTHQIAVDDFVLVQRDERAEALPSDLLHALHLLDEATVSHRGVGAGGGGGKGGASEGSCGCAAYREVLWQPALVDVLVAGTVK